MDNNQMNQPVNMATPEANTLINTDQNTNPGGGNKMIIVVIAIVVLLLIIGGGAYWFLAKQKSTLTRSNQVQPVSIQTSDLQTELQNDQITDPQNDFTEVDKDIQNL